MYISKYIYIYILLCDCMYFYFTLRKGISNRCLFFFIIHLKCIVPKIDCIFELVNIYLCV